MCLVAMAALLAACTQVRDVGGSGGGAVIESFGVTPVAGDAPLRVAASWRVTGVAAGCRLTPGDGSPGHVPASCDEGSVEHVFTKAGTYSVGFEVEGVDGRKESREIAVYVSDAGDPGQNHQPTLSGFAAEPSSGKAPLPVTFAWRATDPDGDALTCTLQTSDGAPLVRVEDCDGDESVTHTYAEAGSYKAVLVVSDGRGGTATAETTVTVTGDDGSVPANEDPVVGGLEVRPAQGSAPVTVTVAWDVSDPDGDTLTCVVDLGDGATRTVAPCDGDEEITHTYTVPGHYVVTVTVTDGKGGTTTRSTGVNVTLAPTVVLSTGTSLLRVDSADSPVLDAVVSGLLGDAAAAGIVSWEGLAGVEVDGLALLAALEDVAGVTGWDAVLGKGLGLAEVVQALIALVPDPGLGAELTLLKDTVLGTLAGDVVLRDLIGTGDVPDVELATVLARTDFSVLDLLVGSLQLYNHEHVGFGDMVAVELPLALGLGVVDVVEAHVSVIEPPRLVVAREGTSFASAALRLELDVALSDVTTGVPGATIDVLEALLNVPLGLLLAELDAELTLTRLGLYLDLAPTTGTVTAIDPAAESVTVSMTPGAAELRLGLLDAAGRAAFHVGAPLDSLSFGEAVIGGVELAVLTKLTGDPIGAVALGVGATASGSAAGSTQGVTVSPLPGVGRVGTSSAAVQALLAELVGSLDVAVTVDGSSGALGGLLGVLAGLLGDVAAALLDVVGDAVAALPLEPLLTEVVDPALRVLGVSVGEGAVSLWSVAGE